MFPPTHTCMLCVTSPQRPTCVPFGFCHDSGCGHGVPQHEQLEDYIPDDRSSLPVPSKADGLQPVSDVSVTMGDHASDKSTGTEARVDRPPATKAPEKTPSGKTNKSEKAPIGGGFSSSKLQQD